MKIKILKENFPSDMPTGPSLGKFDGTDNTSSMPETQRKIMALIEIVGKKLDELELYDKAYVRLFSSMFKDLEPLPKTRVNEYGEHFYIKGPDGEIVHETLDETAAHVAKTSLQGRTGTNLKTFKKYYEKTISQATQIAEIFEEINQYLVLIETLELDRELALHAKKHIFKNRKIEFPQANRLVTLYDYGDYIAATGLAIKHYSKIIEGFANPSLGEYIRTGALSFSENFNALSEMMTEVLMSSGDLLKTRHDFVDAIVPELLKYMMKSGGSVSIYDLRNHGFFEEMRKKFPVSGGGQIDGLGGAKVLIRKALKTLIDKGYIVQEEPDRLSRHINTRFKLNPQMAQQTGKEYFPKPEKMMENKMKLTKQKLEQLIMEEYKSRSRRIFDKRREFPEGGLIRAFGNQDQPINRPELHDKLTTLGSSGPEGFHQAKDLADSIDEPLDIKVDPSNMETFEIDNLFGNHLQSPEFDLHYEFLMDGRGSSLLDEPDIGEMDEFSFERGLNRYDTREKIMKSYEVFAQNKYIKHGGFDPTEEVKKVFPTAGLGIKKRTLREATGEQKRQQKRDAYSSRERQRKKMKARIKRSQAKKPVESPIKGEPIDFDPINDMAKIFKDKGYGVRVDGEEIED